MTARHELEISTGILRGTELLEAWCEIGHLIPSGRSITQLFAELRPGFLTMIEYAAVQNGGASAVRQHPSVLMTMDEPDPCIELRVPCPVSFLQDVEKGFAALEAMTTRFVNTHGLPAHWGKWESPERLDAPAI